MDAGNIGFHVNDGKRKAREIAMHGRNAERNKGLPSGGVRWVKSTVVRVEMKCVPSTTQSLCGDEGGEGADWTVTRGVEFQGR